MSMFCYQCEQTAQSSGCTSFGVCGKDPDPADVYHARRAQRTGRKIQHCADYDG